MRRALIAAFFALAAASAAREAQAHAHLKKAVPAAGGTVTEPPREIRLTFSEGVEPRLSGLALADAQGKKAATGKAAADPKDPAVLVVPVTGTLASGSYKVAWHAVAVDSHKTSGSFGFTLKQP